MVDALPDAHGRSRWPWRPRCSRTREPRLTPPWMRWPGCGRARRDCGAARPAGPGAAHRGDRLLRAALDAVPRSARPRTSRTWSAATPTTTSRPVGRRPTTWTEECDDDPDHPAGRRRAGPRPEPQPRADHRRSRGRRAARPALAADVAAGLGPRPHRQLRGALAAARGRRRAAIDPSIDDLYDAFEHPRAERPTLPLLGPTRRAPTSATVRDKVARLARHGASSTTDPLLRDGLRLRHGHPARAPARRDDARHPPAPRGAACPTGPSGAAAAPRGSPRRPRCWSPAGPFAMGTSDDPWAYDNERPGPRGRPAGVPDRHRRR